MALNDAYLDALVTGGNPITHIALMKADNTPIAAARQAVSWGAPATGGDVRLSADYTFAIAAGEDVAGWQGYNAATAGTAYGIVPLSTPEPAYGNPGQFVLEGANTGINHTATGA